jgi:hypothetical protein
VPGRLSDPREKEAAQGGALEAEQVAPFRFPVTWSSLVDAGPLSSANNLPVEARPRPAGGRAGAQWSMVVPRMAQPAATVALPAAGSIEAARFSRPRYVAPRFEVSLDSASLAVKVLLCVAVAMVLVPGWHDTGSPGARAVQMESSMSAANFVRESTSDGEIALCRASANKTDFRLQFIWTVNPRGVAWVFRFKDARNYYGVRIKLAGPADSRMLSVEHFAASNGPVRSRMVKLALLSPRDARIPIRMEASGSQFRVLVNDAPVSQWTDARLTSGGFGFIENGGWNDIHSARISFP